MSLFIIGNGFDIAHGMPTKYQCFREYVLSMSSNNTGSNYIPPSTLIAPDGGYYINQQEVAQFICYLLDCNCNADWSDFESGLGEMDLFYYFDDLGKVYDRDGDENLFHEAYNNEDRAADLCNAIYYLRELFREWIGSIELPKNRLGYFSKLIDPEHDIFINFNYTQTLEILYGCKNVLHIHGEQGDEIIFGHNGKLDYSSENPKTPIGCFNRLQDLYESFRKDTSSVITLHKRQLIEAAQSEKVYSFGFSFSDIDKPYISFICSHMNNRDIKWFFNGFDAKDNERIASYKKTLTECGFHGSFHLY